MRWLVEVMSLGKTDKESLSVEAESWQKALQAAREQRGESAPMSGFSIELLDDGCRAVDPMSRLRYEVHRVPDEAAPARTQSSRPGMTAAGASSRPRAMSQPPRPSSQAPTASQPPHPTKRPPLSAAALSAIGQTSPSTAPPAPAPAPVAPASIPPPAAVSSPVAISPPASTPPHAAVAPSVTPKATARTDVGLNVPSQVIFKREHDATDALPLTYREYVFLVSPGASEAASEALLQTQLELVLASLARIPAGKLVNLAVFDVAFQGKPSVRPLATLMWKDWRGAPVVEFPRRPGYTPRPSPAPPPQPTAVATPSQPPPAVTQSPAIPPPAPIAAPAPMTAPAPIAAPAPAVPLAPTPMAVVVTAPVVVSAPINSPSATAVAVVPLVAPRQPVAAVPLSVPAASPTPVPAPRTRMRGEDLIADLFESMHDLHFLRDAVEGGNFCLSLAMEKIPSQSGIVHLYDIDRREFLVTSTQGVAASGLLLRRHAESDVMLSTAMGNRRALVVADATQSEAASLERYVALGGARSLVVAPVMQAGRFLGAIEILNPLDGQPYTEADGNALTYIAEQFADFVESRGVVTDPERISSRAG
jgi:hypothetical protein